MQLITRFNSLARAAQKKGPPMNYLRSSNILWSAMYLAALSTACSDDDEPSAVVVDAAVDVAVDAAVTSVDDTRVTNDTSVTDKSASPGETSVPSGDAVDAGASDVTDSVDVTVPDASTDEGTSSAHDDAGTSSQPAEQTGTPSGPDTGSTAGETSEPSGPMYPEVPALFSVSGCSDVGPLCTISQEGATLTANCGGRLYGGTINQAGEISLAAAPELDGQGATVTRSCVGQLSGRGRLTADCTTTTAAVGQNPEATQSCQLVSDATILPSVECDEVPSELTDVAICAEGEASGGETIIAGTCKVVQDGCFFQAECDGDLTIVGEVRGSELRFTKALKALADAQTPANGGSPAFLAGAVVNHSCAATLDGTALTGTCGAGSSGRGGTNTSVCAVTGLSEVQPQCEQLAPSNELIFALDSCDPMKYGGEGEPGIGEPLCAFRQNNCIWDIQCGRDLKFTGRLQPGATKFNWKLQTGTQCEGGFSESGAFNGVCAVPGLFSCEMWSQEAAPGGEECPSAPVGLDVTSRGCGNGSGDAMECRELAWHGCDFMAICSFSYMQSLVFWGTASEKSGVGRVDLTGIGPYQCHALAPTADDLLADPYRAPNEWIGQCETKEGAQCRNNFNPETGQGFRGLQLFWGDVEAPETIGNAVR